MADFIVDDKDFEYAHSALIANLSALLASDRLHDLGFADLPGFNLQRTQLRLGQFAWLFAIVAESPDEPLGHDRAHRGRNQKRLHTDVDQSGYSGRRVIGVKRAENKMPGQACIDCDACSLEVANLADHNDVWRLTQDRAQSRRKRHADLRIDLHLVDPGHLIFDRLFHRDNFAVWFIDVVETGVKGARLSRAGGAGNEKNPIGELDQTFKNLLVVGKKSKLW